MVQHRAAWNLTNRYQNTRSMTTMLDHLEWETVEARWTKNGLIMFFKIIHETDKSELMAIFFFFFFQKKKKKKKKEKKKQTKKKMYGILN